MQSPSPSKSATPTTLFASLCVCALLPSCAIKRLVDRGESDSVAANAESLQDALAILDKAIEETAPSSEISSIPLNVPTEADLGAANENREPVIQLVGADDEAFESTETLFELGGDTLDASAAPADELILEAVPQKPREHVVVRRPAPNYSHDTRTTQAIDEFRKVRTTAYSHTEADHIKYGELSAMGKPLRFGMVRSAAADWSRYPVGTRFRIVGKPYEYVVDDYGSALVGSDTIDLYKPSDDRMDEWGVREVEIEVIAWGSFGRSLEILEPRTEFGEHVQQMIDAISAKPLDQAFASGDNDASINPYE